MSAALRLTEPRASTPQRYAGRTDQEKARLIRAEVQLITRFFRAGNLQHVNWSCHVCRQGRVLIERKESVSREIRVRTKGKCSTSNCLDWED
jgi:hypothetical protein